jgi:hypothetical protein
MLDLWRNNADITSRPQPGEGTGLPGFYDLHRQELQIGAAILVAAALLIAVFRYRTYLRNALVSLLVAALRLHRKTATKAQLFWSEVRDRADSR